MQGITNIINSLQTSSFALPIVVALVLLCALGVYILYKLSVASPFLRLLLFVLLMVSMYAAFTFPQFFAELGGNVLDVIKGTPGSGYN